MPRKYIPKGNVRYRQYNPKNIAVALNDVRSGGSVKEVAKMHKIPISTLRDKLFLLLSHCYFCYFTLTRLSTLPFGGQLTIIYKWHQQILTLCLLFQHPSRPATQVTVVIYPGRYPCGTCDNSVAWDQRGVACETCVLWYHASCQNIVVLYLAGGPILNGSTTEFASGS